MLTFCNAFFSTCFFSHAFFTFLHEADWDRYEKHRDGKEPDVTSLTKLAGSRFKFASLGADGQVRGDGLSILAPDKFRQEKGLETKKLDLPAFYLSLPCVNFRYKFQDQSGLNRTKKQVKTVDTS